jgi:AMP-binding enzyme/phosphopantetheine binding protein
MSSDASVRPGLAERCLDGLSGRAGSSGLTWAGGRMNAGRLSTYVDVVADLLRREVADGGGLVALPAQRGPDAVTAVLGALAARVPFAPVRLGDPLPAWGRDHIAGRLSFEGSFGTPDWRPLFHPAGPVTSTVPAGAAYVMSTSGTTLRPQAAVVGRAGLTGVFGGLRRQFEGLLPRGARWTHAHELTFGFSMCEILGALTFGGEIAVVAGDSPFSADGWLRAASGAGAVVACITPSELSVLCAKPEPLVPAGTHLYLILSGEAAHKAPLSRLFARTSPEWLTVINTYAATETSGQICADVITPATVRRTMAGYVGRPLPGVRVDLEMDGEIVVSGPTIGPGYLDPERTAERFEERAGAVRFHTRDLGKWSDDGGLVVVGRASSAVKLGGRWVNLDELERTVAAIGSIRDAVCAVGTVRPPGTEPGEVLLVAVATAESNLPLLRRELVRQLDLPVTVQLVVLDEVPRTPNGKTDRAAAVAAAEAAVRPGPGGPGSVHEAVTAAWRTVLGAGVPPGWDLADQGIDSLGRVAVAATMAALLGRPIGVEFLLSNPTIADQIRALSGTGTVEPSERAAPSPGRPDISARRRLARAQGDST